VLVVIVVLVVVVVVFVCSGDFKFSGSRYSMTDRYLIFISQ